MKICLAGEGAQGRTHMQAVGELGGIEVVTLAGGLEADTAAFAQQWSIPHWSLDLETCLRQPGVEAVILTTPSQVHAEQTELALTVGKHVLVEIPMAVNLEDSKRLARLEVETGLVCMVAHTRRFSPVTREICDRVHNGRLQLHHIVSETYFFRRENMNRFGKPRTWVDDLLWHHGCHVIDFLHWLFDEPEIEVAGRFGPVHAELGIPMDLTISMRSSSGCLVSAVLSFNNHGPIELSQRFIGEQETLRVEGRKLLDHEGSELVRDDAAATFVAQDREFFQAIATDRKPVTSFAVCLPTMAILDRIERACHRA